MSSCYCQAKEAILDSAVYLWLSQWEKLPEWAGEMCEWDSAMRFQCSSACLWSTGTLRSAFCILCPYVCVHMFMWSHATVTRQPWASFSTCHLVWGRASRCSVLLYSRLACPEASSVLLSLCPSLWRRISIIDLHFSVWLMWVLGTQTHVLSPPFVLFYLIVHALRLKPRARI